MRAGGEVLEVDYAHLVFGFLFLIFCVGFVLAFAVGVFGYLRFGRVGLVGDRRVD